MAKKKKQIQNNNDSRVIWMTISLVAALLVFFAVSKMGTVGLAINNLLSYLFGNLYLFPLFTLFGYGIYTFFFKRKHPLKVFFEIGLIILNIAILILTAYVNSVCVDFKEYIRFVIEGAKVLFTHDAFNFGGGVIGNFFYCLLTLAFSSDGVILTIIVLLLISSILLIPLSFYVSLFHSVKDTAVKHHEERQQLREQRRKQEEEEEEKRRLALAQRMNAENEAALSETEETEVQEEPVIEEEPVLKEDHSDVLSKKSQYFINLEEKEVHAKVEETPAEEKPKEPRILKVKHSTGSYRLPPNSLLKTVRTKSSKINKDSADVKGKKVTEILKTFDIDATLINTYIGPSVTKFEIKPDSSVKINKILNLSDNIKMELAAKDIRIEAPIPGKSAVGIEIPNVESVTVRMSEVIGGASEKESRSKLLFALGKDLMGQNVYCDISKMPHLLIAGATGSGKSVCINSMITYLLMKTNPDDVKLVLVDPKKVEFSPYHDVPHLLWPVITEAQMAANMLKKIVVIMEQRYDAFSKAGVRNIETYNDQVDAYNQNLKDNEEKMVKMPYIVVIIDELADLMNVARKEVEVSIQRITQLARASGIHLIVATQRPSTDVITGIIKSNLNSRISFAVASSIDSRTILDAVGAERLLGYGDMLYSPIGASTMTRIQGVFVSDEEIKAITDYVKSQAQPQYEDSYFEFLTNMTGSTANTGTYQEEEDALFDEVLDFIKESQKASTSSLQRRFGIGYNRAARLIDTLEDRGYISPARGSKPREVYVKKDEEE